MSLVVDLVGWVLLTLMSRLVLASKKKGVNASSLNPCWAHEKWSVRR